MKFFGFVLAAFLATGASARAQTELSPFLLPNAAAAVTSAAPSGAAGSPSSPAPARAALDSLGTLSAPANASSGSAPDRAPQNTPVGVYENFNFQAYAGYTFLRFYEAPHMIQSRNGFDLGMSYFYNGGWFGVEGALTGGFGSQFGQRSRFLFGGGGPRFRWAGERALEYWGHVLVGGSHYTPQTAFGSQNAFGYEAGLGVDANAHHRRIAYRLELDMVGTRYFSTYQYSPKVSVGVVYKF